MMNRGDILRLRIDTLNSEGEGIAREEGGSFVVFVPGALPGETVDGRILLRKARYARAQILQVLSPSPDRSTPSCPLASRCGGCQLQHASYPFQLRAKEEALRDALRRLGGLDDSAVEPCVPSPRVLGYRNKVVLPVRWTPEGGSALGFYQRRSHQVVPLVSGCPVLEERLHSLLSLALPFLKDPILQPYREGTRPSGFLREVVARCGSRTGESALCLVVRRTPERREETLLKALHHHLSETLPGFRGTALHITPQPGNFIWSGTTRPFLGATDLHESLGPYRIRFEVSSFFQVNSPQAEHLYEDVLESLGEEAQGHLLELYSGVGSLSLFLASRARSVQAVEEWLPATESLQANAAAHGLEQRLSVLSGKAEDVLEKLDRNSFDGVVLDPPRGGCHPKVLERILNLAPKKVVYVSCNPATLARDLRILVDGGFRIRSLRPFDLFPQTAHVETRALLTP